MSWDVEVTDEFAAWWEALTAEEQDSVTYSVQILEQAGPMLEHPHSSAVRGSAFGAKMRELRVQHNGKPYRVFYAFDPRRMAILLIGADKTGQDRRFYEVMVPKADAIFEEHLRTIETEGG